MPSQQTILSITHNVVFVVCSRCRAMLRNMMTAEQASMRDELYAQIIKQTTNNPKMRAAPVLHPSNPSVLL
jgi:hypothetical protein